KARGRRRRNNGDWCEAPPGRGVRAPGRSRTGEGIARREPHRSAVTTEPISQNPSGLREADRERDVLVVEQAGEQAPRSGGGGLPATAPQGQYGDLERTDSDAAVVVEHRYGYGVDARLGVAVPQLEALTVQVEGL